MSAIASPPNRVSPSLTQAAAQAATAAAGGPLESPGLVARTVSAGRASGASSAGRSPTAARVGGAKTSATKKTTTRKTTAKKTTTKKTTGYSKTTLPAEFAFLRDAKLSVEEKLARFIGLIMSKAEKDLLAQMEKMAPGSKTSATGGSSGTGGSAATKPKGFSLWGVVKAIVPGLGMASELVGDAAVKGLVKQLSGPLLASAATALGMPQLAPLALKAGPALAALVTDEAKATGGGSSGATGSSGTSSASGTSSQSTAKASDDPKSEKADMLELQRLMEREKETFSLLSNILRMNHEARMTSVNNIR